MTSANPKRTRLYRALTGYYERITPLLLSPARRQTGIMHQVVWAEHTRNRVEALLHISGLVRQALTPVLAPGDTPGLVVDLGCGIGGTAVYLAQQAPMRVLGVTLSSYQARAANDRAARAAVGAHCHFIVADYLRPPVPAGVDCAYALESFGHCHDPARFFQVVGDFLRIGGRFVLFDFFLAAPTKEIGDAQISAWIERFRLGWQLGPLLTAAGIEQLAAAAGLTLVDETDLSRVARRRADWAILLTKPMVHLPVPGPTWGALAGATAGEVCLREGWLKCGIFVFEKAAASL